MIRRVLVLALLLTACSKSRVVEPRVDGGEADAGSEKPTAVVADAGPPKPAAESIAWSTKTKTLAYLRNEELLLVETERFTVRTRIQIPRLKYPVVALVEGGTMAGGALVFGSEGESFEAERKVVIVSPAGPVRTESLGTARTAELDAPAFIDEEASTFTRLLIEDSEDGQKPPRLSSEVRSLVDASVKSTTKLPAWFHGRMNAPPTHIGCRESLCAFGVAPPGAEPTFDDDTVLLSLFDLKERSPKLLSSVRLGASGEGAFGKNPTLAVTFGAGTDPILVDTKTLAVRGLGRRGTKADFMQSAACIAFSPDGSLIASSADREPVSLFETATGKRRWKSAADGGESVAHWRSCGVTFGPDGHVLDYSQLGNIQKLDVATGKKLVSLARAKMFERDGPVAVGNESWLTGGSLSPNGAFFLMTERGAEDTMLDTRTWTVTPFKSDGVFDPTARFYVVDDQVLDMTTRKPIATLP